VGRVQSHPRGIGARVRRHYRGDPGGPPQPPLPSAPGRKIVVTVAAVVGVALAGAAVGLEIASSRGSPASPAPGRAAAPQPGGPATSPSPATSSGPASAPSPATSPTSAAPPPAAQYAQAEAGFQRAQAALRAAGYQGALSERLGGDCATSSYGQVHGFFRAHPCRWLARAYLAVSQPGPGGTAMALVAISWVDMPTAQLAGQYKRLVDTGGTGNVTELSRDTGPYQDVSFSGAFYQSGSTGTAVWNVQAQPVQPIAVPAVQAILRASRQ
jgi:hypothetical protein